MKDAMNPLFVQAWRGETVESVHAGALAVVDAEGSVRLALGDIDRPVFPRSAVKPLQALPLLAGGAAARLALTDDELAVACASHNGEPEHVRTVQGLLAKAGLDEAALECGTHWPALDAAARALAVSGRHATALHNNCSGKHAGFLCVGRLLCDGGADLRRFVEGYVSATHPVMREVDAALQATTGFDLDEAPRATDGCSIPAYAIPLRRLALAFARLGTGIGLGEAHAQAAQRLRRAVAASPFMVAGTGRFDTRVMQRLGERVLCKVGAEGMYCAALPELGLGVAIKIDDGSTARAAEATLAAVIEALLPLTSEDAAFMRTFSDARLRNWRGLEVGRLAVADSLRQALARGERRSALA